jgi:hypothetical protein
MSDQAPDTQTKPYILVQGMNTGDIFFQQAEVDPAASRKVIDTMLDTPEGSGISVTILTGGRALQFSVSSKDVEIGDIVRVYNGIKVSKKTPKKTAPPKKK